VNDHRDLLWIASRLLSYPSPETRRELFAVDRSLQGLPPRARVPLERFLRHVKSADLLELQEEYVRTFDLTDQTPLYLTYVQNGDGRDRGRALLTLKERYQAAGLDPETRELPDYLPMVLEFVSLAPDEVAREIAHEFKAAVAQVGASLRARDSPYADVLALVADTFVDLAAVPRTRWWGR
jgi:nitrate reductase molybdenum cofactor assembly chaperone NarJ/NarW